MLSLKFISFSGLNRVSVVLMLSKGISVYVSTLILILITLSIGLAVFIYSYSVADMYYNAFAREAQRALEKQSLTILASYIANQTLIVIGSTGSYPATIYGIYINDTFSLCSIAFGNSPPTPIGSNSSVDVPTYKIGRASCRERV